MVYSTTVAIASGGRWKPPRWRTTKVSATATITSAVQLHQRTRRRNIRSTSGAISRMSPRISSWMNGMLTSVNVKDSGTVNSTSAVPTPDSAV